MYIVAYFLKPMGLDLFETFQSLVPRSWSPYCCGAKCGTTLHEQVQDQRDVKVQGVSWDHQIAMGHGSKTKAQQAPTTTGFGLFFLFPFFWGGTVRNLFWPVKVHCQSNLANHCIVPVNNGTREIWTEARLLKTIPSALWTILTQTYLLIFSFGHV